MFISIDATQKLFWMTVNVSNRNSFTIFRLSDWGASSSVSLNDFGM